jgi:hypothetical protein
LGDDDDTKAGGCPEALLASGEDNVDTPAIHLNILACDSADGIENNECVGGDPFHGISHRLRVQKYTCEVHVR